jgi:hypothetical protein
MKKILFIAIALLITIQAVAQGNPEPAYIVFTPTTGDVQGIYLDIDDNDPNDLYRSPTRDYDIFSRPAGYFFWFTYMNRKTEPVENIILKPMDFLDTVDYIDWDEIGPTLTKEQASEVIAEILTHETIYFIEKPKARVIVNYLELVPVGLARSRY